MTEWLRQGKQKTSLQIKDEFAHDRGSRLLESILDVLLGGQFDEEKSNWCLWLLSGGQDPEPFLNTLKQQNASAVCGLVWNSQFVAYRCRDCAISPCMSLCADCFVDGNHEGHDFNMFRSQAGGACDCGDENVMRKQGFCSNHGSDKKAKKRIVSKESFDAAMCLIPRIFLKMYDEFQCNAEERLMSQMPPSVKILLSLLQKMCEVDDFRDLTAKSIMSTIPRAIPSDKRKPVATQSRTSRLRPTISTASGHTLVHSIPSSPLGPELISEEESFELLDYLALNPVHEMNFDVPSPSFLDFLMHVMVKYEFPNSLATFMLQLLPDTMYKEVFTRTFCRNYVAIGKTLSQSPQPELLSNHLVHVSVQLFSSDALATTMVQEERLLETLIAVLVDMIGGCLQSYEYVFEGAASSVLVANCDNRILIKHCYWPVASDLINVLSHKDVVKIFLEDDTLLHQWMYLVTLLTAMNVNNRRITSHTQYEPRTYITSFSVEFESVCAVMWELVRGCNKLKEVNSHYILKLIKATENALTEWYKFVPVKPSKSAATFHLSLHRYLALFVSQATTRFGIDGSKAVPSSEVLAFCMEYPLRTLVALCEIKAGLWVYSGFQMRGQALSYVQCHFCNSMVDLDLFFVQVAASRLDPDYFLTMLIERFSIGLWFQFGEPLDTDLRKEKNEKELAMVESFISFILVLLSHRVFSGVSESQQCRKDLAALLCVANKTHSQLSDMIPTRPGETNETSKNFETALAEMAEFKAPSLEANSMQQGTYTPKDSVWDEDFDYLHIHLRFFMSPDHQKAMDRYTANMRQRGLTEQTHCWPPLRNLDEIHPEFKSLYRILHCKTLHKIIFFILYKAVENMTAVSEIMLVNTIHLLHLALNSPVVEGGGYVPEEVKSSKEKRVKVAEKCIDYLEAFARNDKGLYGTGERELRELNSSMYRKLHEDENFVIDENSTKTEDVVTILQHVLFAKNKFSLFDPMLAYTDNVVEESIGPESIKLFASRHLQHLQYLLTMASESRYHLLKKLFKHWRSCSRRDGVRITMYTFCRQRHERPGFSLLLNYFVEDYDWLFRINNVRNGDPCTLFDINYSSGSIAENASVPVCSLIEKSDESLEMDQLPPRAAEQQSMINLLVKLLDKLKECSKVIRLKNSRQPIAPTNIVAGDGTYHVTKLLRMLRNSNVKNQSLIDSLAPHIGRRDGAKKRVGSVGSDDDAQAERNDRRKKAIARQRKILAEFMTKQEVFKEHNTSTESAIDEEDSGEQRLRSDQMYDCVICGQSSSSTCDRPLAVAVLLQSTTVLSKRKRDQDNEELPLRHPRDQIYCGSLAEKRKAALLQSFDKVAAGRAFEVGIDCGVHLQTCGHYLHIDCQQSYFKSLQDQHIRTFTYEHHTFDIQKGYFTCPLCRQPCNGILPILPDSIRKRTSKQVATEKAEIISEMTSLLTKYSEAGSLSPLTARALEFTVLTAATATFMTLLSSTLKNDGHPATTMYSDRTIKEKFLILVSTVRSCLELEYIEVCSNAKKAESIRSCLGHLIEVLQFHAQCLDGPIINIWRELTSSEYTPESMSSKNGDDRSKIPILLRDVPTILVQFILTWPTWISLGHYRCLVQMLFNLSVVQAFVNISLNLEGEEYRSWERLGRSFQNKGDHVTYDILGVVTSSLSRLKVAIGLHESELSGISQSLLSPQAIELRVQQFCLPLLRQAAMFSHSLFETPLPNPKTHDEFLELVNICGLVAEEREGIEMTEVLPSRCLKWPFSNSVMTIRSWCHQLEEVLLAKGGKEKKIDMNILPLSHNWPVPRLVSLPHSYDSLFQFYRKQKCKKCKKVPDDPTVCLVCGAFLCFRSNCCADSNGVYECVRHAVDCGCGTGIFLIISTSAVLIIRSERGCVWGSVYLDSFGEEDKDLKRGKPLYLSKERYEHLQHQWLTHSFDRSCKSWGRHNNCL